MTLQLTPDDRQRAQLERQRARLLDRVDALHQQAMQLWYEAQSLRTAGRDVTRVEDLARDIEARCLRIHGALIAIADELGEVEDD